ncbi:phage conserved hypothetical protein, phiE125 gp8 family [Bosea lathyri]|uniref:Phage gp6-like head-tail connector protein n=2 Tax=Bosea lathyri TaxID=1036778 RepID=A0A1H6BE18_9HYPH|nr:phage conserved hypothetical protein, phiE125 gp8 family [Bosea lathyri]
MRCLPPELVTPPSGDVVSLIDAKRHLRVDHNLDDDRITLAIQAAVSHLDGYTGILGRALLAQSWRQFSAYWPASRCFDLALAPVAEIISVSARGSGGLVAVPSSSWRLFSGASRPMLMLNRDAQLPDLDGQADAVTVTYKAGYGEAAEVPAAIRHAILLMVGDAYRFSETVALGASSPVPMSITVDRMVSPFRRSFV